LLEVSNNQEACGMSRRQRKNQSRYNQPQSIKDSQLNQVDNKPVATNDAFANPLARLGAGQENILEATQYPLTRLTKNYQLMNALYRSHWIIRKVINTIPEDMCKNWIKVQCQVEPDMIQRLEKLQRKAQIKAKMIEGLEWGRLYGGAAALMMIEGHEDILNQPLDYRMIVPGSFKGLMVLDRWAGINPGMELVDDISDPEFGLPKYYRIVTESSNTYTVHHSRILRFIGRGLPYWERVAEQYWGISEVEVLFEELKKRDNTSWNIAQLVFLANLRVLKMNDLGQDLAVGDISIQKELYNVLSNQNWLMSNMGMQILDKEDDFATHQYAFSGLDKVYENFMLDLSGACEIPATRLFGRAPQGMNATGEGDEKIYEGSIEQKQEAYLRPAFDKLLPVMCMSEWGAIPDDLDYEFNPIGSPSDKDKADLAKNKTDSILSVYNAGIFGRKTALKELREMQEATGMYSNITDEMIDQADDDTNQGELFGGSDPFGGLGGAKPGSSFGQPNKVNPGLSAVEPKNTQDSKSFFDKIMGFFTTDGGEGSGNFGHKGRPGEIGGSGKGGTSTKNEPENSKSEVHPAFRNLPGKSKIGTRSTTPGVEGELIKTEFDTPRVLAARRDQAKLGSTHEIMTKERQELRRKIRDELYNLGGEVPKPGKKPRLAVPGGGARKKEHKAWFIMGLPASGKSTIADPLVEEYGAMLIDADEAKKLIPEFGDGKFAGAVHNESSWINAKLFKKAASAGDNMIMPLVGRNKGKVRMLCNLLKKRGYEIHLQLMDLSPEEAARRALTRLEETDRFVDPDYILNEIKLSPRTNYDILKSEGGFASYVKYSNDVPRGEKPKLIESFTSKKG
jgi:phage-related protein (TIGR01555 family)